MKKVLSLTLALVMLISCMAIFAISAGAADALTAACYTVKDDVAIYVVYNQKVSITGDGSFALAPIGLLANGVVINDYVLKVANDSGEYNMADILKNGHQGTAQKFYNWGNGVTTADGTALVEDATANIWGQDHVRYNIEYKGEVDTVDAIPTPEEDAGEDNDNPTTADPFTLVAVVALTAGTVAVGSVSKKKK